MIGSVEDPDDFCAADAGRLAEVAFRDDFADQHGYAQDAGHGEQSGGGGEPGALREFFRRERCADNADVHSQEACRDHHARVVEKEENHFCRAASVFVRVFDARTADRDHACFEPGENALHENEENKKCKTCQHTMAPSCGSADPSASF